MQLAKPIDETAAAQAQTASPGGLAGCLLSAFVQLSAGGWRSRSTTRQRELKLIETLSLGGRRQLMLVNCGGERLLIGVGPDSVDSMIRLSDGAASEVGNNAKTMAGSWS